MSRGGCPPARAPAGCGRRRRGGGTVDIRPFAELRLGTRLSPPLGGAFPGRRVRSLGWRVPWADVLHSGSYTVPLLYRSSHYRAALHIRTFSIQPFNLLQPGAGQAALTPRSDLTGAIQGTRHAARACDVRTGATPKRLQIIHRKLAPVHYVHTRLRERPYSAQGTRAVHVEGGVGWGEGGSLAEPLCTGWLL